MHIMLRVNEQSRIITFFLLNIEYSVGAIYLIIQNLPRCMRYKRENVILVGLIPGPKEPKLTMNSFLQPLVHELKELWEGVNIPCPSHPSKYIFIRAALTCCACDIPATRKLCGFVGHNANLGCSKCSKVFPSIRHDETIRDKRDFSGYEREHWPVRSLENHREKAYEHLNAQTKTQQKCIEKEYGVRYSALLELPYWDPLRFSVVDPMHNLFLGTGKHIMHVWIDQGILSRRDFTEIESITSKIRVPHDVGRIPLKIQSSFSGFTADQWRNWITVFSPVALKGILPSNHLRCWLLFVRACYLICARIITTQVIDQIDMYLVQFCKQFEQLYGAEACTPNMHLHLHLKECLQNYGPVHGFWCYGFERLNGQLGKYHNNNQSIEVQLMRKFLREIEVRALNPPDEAAILFSSLNNTMLHDHESDSLNDDRIFKLKALGEFTNLYSNYSITPDLIYLLPPVYKGVLNASEIQKIQTIYSFLYSNTTILHFSHFYQSSRKCCVANELFTTKSVITAFWPVESYNMTVDGKLQVGKVLKFLKHSIKIKENNDYVEKVHVFCIAEWYMKHHSENYFGSSSVMCTPVTYTADACQFMPIQRIYSRCAYGEIDVTLLGHATELVFVAIPIHLNYCI